MSVLYSLILLSLVIFLDGKPHLYLLFCAASPPVRAIVSHSVNEIRSRITNYRISASITYPAKVRTCICVCVCVLSRLSPLLLRYARCLLLVVSHGIVSSSGSLSSTITADSADVLARELVEADLLDGCDLVLG